jgi:hypothetical protein
VSNQRDESRPVRTYAVKLRNRRIIGGLLKDGSISFRLRYLTRHRTIRETLIRLSPEACDAMAHVAWVLTQRGAAK